QVGGRANRNWFDIDMFWVYLGNGHYQFDATKIAEGEKWCADQCIAAMANDLELVIVSTDDPSADNVSFYAQLADNHGYDVSIVRTPRPWSPHELKERTTYRTPVKVIQKQIKLYEEHQDEREASQTTVF
ncbi:unnamed protein product, partial [marine sediment metagenome]